MVMTETQTPQPAQNLQPRPDVAMGRPEGLPSAETLDKVNAHRLGSAAVKTEVEPQTPAGNEQSHVQEALVNAFKGGGYETLKGKQPTAEEPAQEPQRAPHIEQPERSLRPSAVRKQFYAQTR